MTNVYEYCPTFESERFTLRLVRDEDAEQLLKVYSDAAAVPNFNGDNCHGDDFHYTTLERMREAVKFWKFSYDNGYFVRWVVEDKQKSEAVGTIELFHRDSEIDAYGDCGLLRLDLRSDYEKADFIFEILTTISEPTFDLFYCDKIATKIKEFALERKKGAERAGFVLTGQILKGNAGEDFTDYYTLKKPE